MTNNNTRICLLLSLVALALARPSASRLQELENVTLHHQEQSYHLPVSVNHRPLKLAAELREGRTWVKESLCKVCGMEGEECKDSCMGEKEPKISCDSSYCSLDGEYSDQSRGISGNEAEVFVKVDDAQVLMPLVLADKLSHPHAEFGFFNLFDPDTSFHKAIMTRTPLGSLEVLNLQKLPNDKSQGLRQKDGSPLNISMKEQFGFQYLRSQGVRLHHVSNDSFVDFQDEEEYELDFSLQSFPIQLPFRLAKRLQKHLLQNYLQGKRCKLLPKKLKCVGEIDATQLFQSVLHFQLPGNQLVIPLHMLFTACSANECNTLINFSQSDSAKILFGYIVWELYNLEYDLDGRYLLLHRRNTQWDDLFLKDKVDIRKMGFLSGLFLIIFHTLKYVVIAIFWLAVLSLFINLLVHWRKVLGWLRGLLLRRRKERVAQQEDEVYEERSFRRISKPQNPFEDSETI